MISWGRCRLFGFWFESRNWHN